MEKHPCVYILASRRLGTLYVGVTSNLIQWVYQHRNNEARRGLQPRRLRFVYAAMPAKLHNITDGITNPVRLNKNKTDSVLTTESAFGLNGSLVYRTKS
jgi:predicted GIY-YIG superfamily endonuclease